MPRRPERTAAQLRRANRGNVPGVLGMAEMAMLMPKREPADPVLLAYGYAPGNYMIKCIDCGATPIDCDKRAARCKQCAQRKAYP